MFSTSSQRKFWQFSSEQELSELRASANRSFVEKMESHSSDSRRNSNFLTPAEELLLCRQHEYFMRDFCRKFRTPKLELPMPKSVVGTAFNYFKRFYLRNSVMDYHPKEILITCLYLASKVEEFNVSISDFVANVNGDKEKATDIILNNELLLMHELDYHLTVHNPFRPVRGFLIDIKTRCPMIKDPDLFRPSVEEFIDQIFLTDACLLFPPSQIALAAILQTAGQQHETYVTDVLLGSDSSEKIPRLMEALHRIRGMAKGIEPPQRNLVNSIARKLERCRNQENNPESVAYKRKMQELVDEEEGRQIRKYARIRKEQTKLDDDMLMRRLDK